MNLKDERKAELEKLERENLKRNGEHYPDPTAYQAIKNIENDNKSFARFRKLLDIIFAACELSGFHLEERIVVKDKRTGKIWR